MAGRNGTGPNGTGPMMGRGMGNCNGSVDTEKVNGFGFGRGTGSGRRFGNGCGFGPGFGRGNGMGNGRFESTPVDPEQEKKILTMQVAQYRTELDGSK